MPALPEVSNKLSEREYVNCSFFFINLLNTISSLSVRNCIQVEFKNFKVIELLFNAFTWSFFGSDAIALVEEIFLFGTYNPIN